MSCGDARPVRWHRPHSALARAGTALTGGPDTLGGMSRPDDRAPDQLRPVAITRHWQKYAEGSALVEFGETKVLCAASVVQGVPRWRKGSGLGWVTAEYAMLPRATLTRNDRESVKGRLAARNELPIRRVVCSLRPALRP